MKTKKSVKWEGVITNIQANVLMALAHYKFLTLSQLLKIGVGTTQYKYLWKQVASLRDRSFPLVKFQRFSTISSSSNGNPPERVEDLYYLSREGEKALVNDLLYEHPIKRPLGRRLAYKDYKHRKRVINFHITLDKWAKEAEKEIPLFDTYFEKEGNNRTESNLRAKTRIDFGNNDFFIPDAAFKIEQNGKQKFYLFEMYNGTDAKRTINQLHKHGQAMVYRYTHTTYNIPNTRAYYIVLLFEKESLKNSVIDRMKKNEPAFSKIEKYFRMKSLEDLEKGDFNEEWLTLYSSSTILF